MKVHGDLDKTYLSNLEGTDEWNTKKMKIKLYCEVPNDMFITILFCLLRKKIITPMIQYSLTNPYPFFGWTGKGWKLIFCGLLPPTCSLWIKWFLETFLCGSWAGPGQNIPTPPADSL